MSRNRQRAALAYLKASGPILTAEPLTAQGLAEYERRQEAVHDAMTAAINRSNPRKSA